MESYNPSSGIITPAATVSLLGGPTPITLHDILAILRRRVWLALSVFAVTVGASLYVTSKLPLVYEATCQLTIDNAPPSTMPSNVMELINSKGSSSSDLILAKMKSRAFLSEVIRKVHHPAMTDPDVLRGALVVGLSGGDQIMNIQVTTKNEPVLAQKLANMAGDVYIEYVRAENKRNDNTLAGRLERMRDKAEGEMEGANAKLQAFTRRSGLSNLQPLYDTQSVLTINVRNSLDNAKRDLPVKESNIAYYQKEVSRIPPTIYAGTTANRNPQIEEFRADIVRLETDREILSADFGEDSNEIKEVNRKMAAKKAALKRLQGNEFSPGSQSIPRNPDYSAARTGLYAAERELHETKDSVVRLAGQLKSLQAEQARLSSERVQYDELVTRAQAARDAYKKAVSGLQQMPYNEMLSPVSMRVLEPARVPITPKSPKPLLNAIAGVVAGLFLGFVSAIVAEYFSVPSRRPGENLLPGLPQLPAAPAFADGLPRLAGVPVLARVPLLRGRGMVSGTGLPTTGESAMTEDAFREIGYLLSHPMDGASARVPVILMAGTRSDETVASVAAYLTATLVRDGVRVTLVDGDRTEPRLHKVFGKPDAPGVTDILAGRVTASAALHTGANGNLRFLAAGAKSDTTPLGEETLRKLYDELGKPSDTDLVVIAGPSVWAARLIAPMERAADGVVLVASDAQISPDESVARARRILTNGYQPRLLGVIVGEEEADRKPRTKAIIEGKTNDEN